MGMNLDLKVIFFIKYFEFSSRLCTYRPSFSFSETSRNKVDVSEDVSRVRPMGKVYLQ